MQPVVSVVIPTYNRADLLRLTLESLVAQTAPRDDFEVIVSDDGSDDGTAELVRSFRTRLRLKYTFQEDLGFRAAAARNAGAAHADAPVLAFLDTGVLAGPELVHSYRRSTAPGRCVLGYTHGSASEASTPGLAQAVRTMSAQDVRDRYSAEASFQDARETLPAEADADLGRYALPWTRLWSLNFAVFAADFWSVGGFDEEFCGWGMEDLELGYRLHHRGTSLRMSRLAWAIETPHERSSAANRASNERNIRRFLTKHRDPVLELYWAWALDDYTWSLDDEWLAVHEWADASRDLSVDEEVDSALRDLPAGHVAAILGCGRWRPDPAHPHHAFDFDDFYVDHHAKNSGRPSGYPVRRALGIRTPLPGVSVDRVVITSRLRGLWKAHGKRILGEANRIGRSVWHPPDWETPRV
ncbi:glycosyltransferase [Plantactinospora sp. KLBMP9567]|uniref:glycosyltransferase n=1 Tax=Plantactinospora sp. KLBMP9567 TaxID=3085900 RepID=UPI002981352E|nr:glycosyltransferase [Plantactinospora sp. KLBMP9567]MDW5323201.1 glycosyltransferase [Plantactinospora sp. KLBMP9567]